MNHTKRAMNVSLTWIAGQTDATPSLSHYAIHSTRGYASLRLREKETVEVLHSAAPATEQLRSEPLAV